MNYLNKSILQDTWMGMASVQFLLWNRSLIRAKATVGVKAEVQSFPTLQPSSSTYQVDGKLESLLPGGNSYGITRFRPACSIWLIGTTAPKMHRAVTGVSGLCTCGCAACAAANGVTGGRAPPRTVLGAPHALVPPS